MRLCVASTALAAVVATSFLPSTCAQSTTNITFSNLNTPYNPSAINLDTGANLTTTLKAVWTRNQSQGVFNVRETHSLRKSLLLVHLSALCFQQDGLKLLAGEVSGATLYGALLRLDASSYIDINSTSEIPFVALVSCDQPETTTASTDSSTLNPNASMSIFDAAANLGAQAVILYSSESQSCILNVTNNSTLALPVYSLPSQASTNMLLQQYNYIADTYQTFNSTALAELTGPSSPLVSSNSSQPVQFLVAVITSNQTFENTSPIVATIGSVVPAASPTTTTTKGPASTTGTTPTTTTKGADGTSSTPSSTPKSSAGKVELGGIVLSIVGGLTLLAQSMM
ncbi:BQ5605_C007g04718 [Microbotryum silenes-dioicae]|uniref:BQ5605_C007g04718 protein n=1 Tax=Microbotryum silenes-dioicae TaxID=796604 RepID=A0A2X0P3D5_9BASI|nr:BQ5605_C007g04718 [Microbotryum silenes-dioicae]